MDDDSAWGTARELFELPGLDRLQRRVVRRLIVVGYIAVLGLTLLLGRTVGEYWVVLLMLVPFTVATVLLEGSVRGIIELRDGQLDERQRLIRGQTFARSYYTGALAGVAGGFAIANLMDGSKAYMGAAVILVMGLIMGLPTLDLAWNLPDEVDETR